MWQSTANSAAATNDPDAGNRRNSDVCDKNPPRTRCLLTITRHDPKHHHSPDGDRTALPRRGKHPRRGRARPGRLRRCSAMPCGHPGRTHHDEKTHHHEAPAGRRMVNHELCADAAGRYAAEPVVKAGVGSERVLVATSLLTRRPPAPKYWVRSV
jgi:hypothetical protein